MTRATRLDNVGELVRSFAPGERVYLPGAAGECLPLMDALCTGNAPRLDITASFVPGINPVALARYPKGTTFTSLFAYTGVPEAQATGRYRHLPLSYSAFAKHLAEKASFDTCIVHVAPPGIDGNCSLGAAVEFTPIAAARARRKVAIINPRMPVLPGAESLALADFDIIVECDAPLREYHAGAVSDEAQRIAVNVATFIEDGSVVQIGLGKAPDALLRILTSRRRLRLHSGMISDGVMALDAAGALDPDWTHTSCVHVGSTAYYAWLHDRKQFAVRNCGQTHSVAVLSALPNFVAVNSALTVDLFGQANLENLDGRMVSGVGGAPDFARGASQSPGGISIIALPSTSSKDDIPRIVLKLDNPCSIPRFDIDVVVTEYGVADLRECNVIERARRLTMIAAPQHRAHLDESFHTIAKIL